MADLRNKEHAKDLAASLQTIELASIFPDE